jgi:hypothetical protein
MLGPRRFNPSSPLLSRWNCGHLSLDISGPLLTCLCFLWIQCRSIQTALALTQLTWSISHGCGTKPTLCLTQSTPRQRQQSKFSPLLCLFHLNQTHEVISAPRLIPLGVLAPVLSWLPCALPSGPFRWHLTVALFDTPTHYPARTFSWLGCPSNPFPRPDIISTNTVTHACTCMLMASHTCSGYQGRWGLICLIQCCIASIWLITLPVLEFGWVNKLMNPHKMFKSSIF